MNSVFSVFKSTNSSAGTGSKTNASNAMHQNGTSSAESECAKSVKLALKKSAPDTGSSSYENLRHLREIESCTKMAGFMSVVGNANGDGGTAFNGNGTCGDDDDDDDTTSSSSNHTTIRRGGGGGSRSVTPVVVSSAVAELADDEDLGDDDGDNDDDVDIAVDAADNGEAAAATVDTVDCAPPSASTLLSSSPSPMSLCAKTPLPADQHCDDHDDDDANFVDNDIESWAKIRCVGDVVTKTLQSPTTLSSPSTVVAQPPVSASASPAPRAPIIVSHQRGHSESNLSAAAKSTTTRFQKRLSLSGYPNNSMPSVHGAPRPQSASAAMQSGQQGGGSVASGAAGANGKAGGKRTRLSTHQRNLSLDFR